MKYSLDCPFCMETRFINNQIVSLCNEESILFENENIYKTIDELKNKLFIS